MVITGGCRVVQRRQAEDFDAALYALLDLVNQQRVRSAFKKVAHQHNHALVRLLNQLPRILYGLGDMGAAAELNFHQQLDRVGDIRREIHHAGVERHEVRANAGQLP